MVGVSRVTSAKIKAWRLKRDKGWKIRGGKGENKRSMCSVYVQHELRTPRRA